LAKDLRSRFHFPITPEIVVPSTDSRVIFGFGDSVFGFYDSTNERTKNDEPRTKDRVPRTQIGEPTFVLYRVLGTPILDSSGLVL
jgi:hypothetical protein